MTNRKILDLPPFYSHHSTMTNFAPRGLRQIALLAAGALAGCSTPTQSIVQVAPDTYVVTVKNRTSIFASEAPNLRAQAVGEAMDFAESKGKVAVPATLSGDTVSAIGDWSKVEYRFTLVDKDDPRARQTSIASGRNSAVEKDDVYAELTKLDDLRKKGVLTEAEFQSEKQKLLNRPK